MEDPTLIPCFCRTLTDEDLQISCTRKIELPVSKSIANRLLMIYAMHGDDLAFFPIDETTPDDVRLLHGILTKEMSDEPADYIYCDNCGTAMRFLTAYFAQREGRKVTLDGSERMQQRPIGQLVDALRQLGAKITYTKEEGFPPLIIEGTKLKEETVTINDPKSTQFISALKLIGVEVQTNIMSPYIEMTKRLVGACDCYLIPGENNQEVAADLYKNLIERDWSTVAFYLEFVAIHGGKFFFPGLSLYTIQGDIVAKEILQPFVGCIEYANGVEIYNKFEPGTSPKELSFNFEKFPDLYPAIFATCVCRGIKMNFTGLEAQVHKESNRIEAMQQLVEAVKIDEQDIYTYHHHHFQSHNDHRVAMALACAYPLSATIEGMEFVSKSFPGFEQYLPV